METRGLKPVINEESYIEKVEYYIRILTLVSEREARLLQECWSYLKVSEGFFDKVFYRMFTEHQLLKHQFDGLEGISDEMLTTHPAFSKHNEEVLSVLDLMIENIQNPDVWMVRVLQVATIHRMYNIGLEQFRYFKPVFLDVYKNITGEDFKETEEILARVLDCVVSFMSQIN